MSPRHMKCLAPQLLGLWAIYYKIIKCLMGDTQLRVLFYQVHEGRLAAKFGRLVWLANLCKPSFPIPRTLSDLGKMDICQESIQHSAQGFLNPQFLGLTKEQIALTQAEDLPKFHDLFEAPEPGPYLTGHTTLQLPRAAKSILSNADSPSSILAVELFFPAGEGSTPTNPVLGNESGAFPLVGFSPGFGGKPKNHHLLFEYLASFGYIIVSQVAFIVSDRRWSECS